MRNLVDEAEVKCHTKARNDQPKAQVVLRKSVKDTAKQEQLKPTLTGGLYSRSIEGQEAWHENREAWLWQNRLIYTRSSTTVPACWHVHTFTYINPVVRQVSRRTSVNQHHNQDRMIKQIHITYTELQQNKITTKFTNNGTSLGFKTDW